MKKHFIKTTIHEYITEVKYQGHKMPVEEIFFQENPHKKYYDRELLKYIDVFIDDATFKENPIQWVDVNKIVPTQKFLSKDNLDGVKDIKIGDNTGAYLVKYNNLYYVIDGHHRIANQIIEGVDKIKAYVQSVNNTNESVEHEQNDNINDNFRKWFGNSKVIDEKGNPLVVYHGTKTNFDIFKPSKSIGNQGETDQIEGMYFTDNKDAASFYSIGDDDRYIKSVFLSLKNPYITDGNNEIKSELGITKLSDVNKTLKNLGYDGLIMKRGFYTKGGPFILYLAFYPNQIKSIRNDGSWDIDDNNIYS